MNVILIIINNKQINLHLYVKIHVNLTCFNCKIAIINTIAFINVNIIGIRLTMQKYALINVIYHL